MVLNPYAKKISSSAKHKVTPARNIPILSSPPLLLPSVTTFSQAFDSSSTTEDHKDTSIQLDVFITGDPLRPGFTSDRDFHVLQQQPHVLYVSTKQHGNPILPFIRNVPWSYATMRPDYIFNSTSCGLFISLKYHVLYRNYIRTRIAELKTDFNVRILLVLVDVEDNEKVLLELNTLAVQQNWTLILGWSEEEIARYLETYKALNSRDASSIQKSKDSGHWIDQMTDVLTTCKGTNKTDAAAILGQFQNLRSVMAASPEELALIAGLGPVKVQRLHDAFHKPFSTQWSRQRKHLKHDA
jgi:DNA excision repair protein ERCC-1